MKLGKWFCHHNVRLVKPDRSINYLTFKGQLNFSKILTPGQGQLIPNWVMLHVKWLLSVRRIEWCHFYSKTFCQPLWPWLDPKVFLEVGSLRLTWWPDLRWPGSKIFREGGERMPGKVYQKRRRCAPPFLRYPKKTAGGGCSNTPTHLGAGYVLIIHNYPYPMVAPTTLQISLFFIQILWLILLLWCYTYFIITTIHRRWKPESNERTRIQTEGIKILYYSANTFCVHSTVYVHTWKSCIE